jgi:hypothetical protein
MLIFIFVFLFSYYSKLPNLKHPVTGDALFSVIKIGMACDECATKNIECTHRKEKVPSWKSGERQKIAMVFVDGDEVTQQQEMMGRVHSVNIYVFRRRWVDRLLERPRWAFRQPVQVLHSVIDPSGGGSGSEYIIFTMTFEGRNRIVSQH